MCIRDRGIGIGIDRSIGRSIGRARGRGRGRRIRGRLNEIEKKSNNKIIISSKIT